MTIEETVLRLVHEQTETPFEQISLSTLLSDLNLDSLDMIYLYIRVEQETGIFIPESVQASITTPAQLVNVLREKVNSPVASVPPQ